MVTWKDRFLQCHGDIVCVCVFFFRVVRGGDFGCFVTSWVHSLLGNMSVFYVFFLF